MPRVRKPNAETAEQDKQIIEAAAVILGAVASRHNNEKLRLAAELADSFVALPAPKPRVRKPKPAPELTYRDGKSAAAHDTRELAHHSV